MRRQNVLVAVIVGGLVAGCNSPASPAPSADRVALASPAGAASPSTARSSSAISSPSPSPSALPTPTPTPSPTATPAPTPAPTPVPWKAFTSKRYHYKIKYPPTWVVTKGGAGISDEFDAYGPPYVYVSRDTGSGPASLNLTVTHAIASIKSHYKAKLSSNTAITLVGWTGRLLKFTGVDNGVKVAIQEIVLAKGPTVYFIDLFADLKTVTADRATFRKMYVTWRPT